jgi:hypothetical protein
VRGAFFEAYASIRRSGVVPTVADLFRPFQHVAETLRTDLGIEVVDDERFEKAVNVPDFERIKEVLQECSQRVRKTEKFANALAHDAKVFLFLRSECQSPESKIWFLTRDASLPVAWRKLQSDGPEMRCFMLDGLLQSISPFVVADEEVKDFSAVFSQVVANQLLPQGKLFDIEDFQLFQELDLDCRELPEEEIEDGLLSVKQHVLKGASYRHENFEEAAYELRRVFAKRGERVGALRKQLQKLEEKIEDNERAHTEHIERLSKEHDARVAQMQVGHSAKLAEMQSQIDKLQLDTEEREKKRARRSLLRRQVLAVMLVALGMFGLNLATKRWGQELQQVVSLSPIYIAGLLFVLVVIKHLLFRTDRLADIFKSWVELKDFLR